MALLLLLAALTATPVTLSATLAMPGGATELAALETKLQARATAMGVTLA